MGVTTSPKAKRKPTKIELLEFQYITENLISTTKKHLRQSPKGTYSTVTGSEKFLHVLTPQKIMDHVMGKATYGFFAGDVFSKCIAFGEDRGSAGLRALQNVLHNFYNIANDQYFIVRSGGKGFHLYIVFDKAYTNQKVKSFYYDVLQRVQQLNAAFKIELRPTSTMGIRLPFGINQKYGVKSVLCDPTTLKKISSKNVWKTRKIDLNALHAAYVTNKSVIKSSWTKPNKKAVKQMLDDTTLNIGSIARITAKKMYETKAFVDDTYKRNITMLRYILYLKEIGLQKHDVLKECEIVLKNSQDYFKTPIHLAIEETKIVYNFLSRSKKNYTLDVAIEREVIIYQAEIEYILTIANKRPLWNLLFTLLVHSKKFANETGEFYMSYAQMAEMGNTKNREALKGYLVKLVELGAVQMVKNTRAKRVTEKTPNAFVVNYEKTFGAHVVVNIIDGTNSKLDKITFVDTATKLMNEKQLKKLVTKRQFYTNFK